MKLPYPLVILICLATAIVIGAAQGYLVAYAKMPSFIVTLGGMLIFRGLTGNMLLGQFVGPFPKGFQNIASGFLPDFTDMVGLAHSLPEWAQIRWVSFLIGVIGAAAMFVSSFRRWRRSKADGMEVEPLPLLRRQERRVRRDHRRHRLEPCALQGPAGHPGDHGVAGRCSTASSPRGP